MYYVFVCPKCQSHSQLWQPSSKTVRCQKCNAVSKTESLRVFGPFETHAEAVEKRAVVQAELSRALGTFADFKSAELTAPAASATPAKPAASAASAAPTESAVLTSLTALTAPIEKEVLLKPPKAKKPQQIITEVLIENGKMIVADCEYYCAERGVDSETFQKIMGKMIEAGIVYRPDKGLVALVP